MKNLQTFEEFLNENLSIINEAVGDTDVVFGASKRHEDGWKQLPKLWDIIGVSNDADKVNINFGSVPTDAKSEEFWNSLLTSGAKVKYKGTKGYYPFEFYVTPDKKIFYKTDGKGSYFKSAYMSKETWEKEVEPKIGEFVENKF